MRRGLWSILGVLAMLCASSTIAKDRKTPALDPQRGAIGVTIKTKGPTALAASFDAGVAFFVKVDEGVDILHAVDVLPSNFSDRKQVYLLNAEPGKYVMVGAYTPGFTSATKGLNDMPSTNVYFDKEMIPATEVSVEAGKVAFAGEIVVKVSVGMKDADEAQTHYGDLIGRGTGLKVGVGVSLPSGQTTTSVGIGHLTRAGKLQSLDKDPKAEREFWTRAIEKVFEHEPDWQELARHRLEAMN